MTYVQPGKMSSIKYALWVDFDKICLGEFLMPKYLFIYCQEEEEESIGLSCWTKHKCVKSSNDAMPEGVNLALQQVATVQHLFMDNTSVIDYSNS